MIDNDNIQWDFCKTARKPYDEVVVAALIYGERVGVIESWNSDGKDKLKDFDDAKKLLGSLS